MITPLRFALPAAAVLALFAAGSPAFAQSAPVPTPDTSRQGVREILNRAETEGARRTVGDILGGIAGISQARAQTAPAQAPTASPPAAPTATDQPAVQAPATSPASGPAIQAAQAVPAAPAAGPSTPAVAQAGQGTPTDPNMIVRVPADGTPAPASAAPPVAAGQPLPPTQGGATQSAAPGAPVLVPGAMPSGPAVVAQTGRPEVVAVRRAHGHYGSRAWCPPPRW